jgi:multimeric flavodoxin WrbA
VQSGFDVIDLRSKKIGHYDYEYQNTQDDFLPLMEEIVENYDVIIFGTPVYWYSMSGIMKNFFDRITDCLKIRKDIGRKLRGKHMGMISCGADADLKEGFVMPFKESANYLGMHYVGDIHTWIENDLIPKELKENLGIFIEEKMCSKPKHST